MATEGFMSSFFYKENVPTDLYDEKDSLDNKNVEDGIPPTFNSVVSPPNSFYDDNRLSTEASSDYNPDLSTISSRTESFSFSWGDLPLITREREHIDEF